VTAPNGDNAFLNTGSEIATIAIILNQYEAGLKNKEHEVRGELSQARVVNKEKSRCLKNSSPIFKVY